MSGFTFAEIEHQREGRPATVDGTGPPRLVPVGLRYGPEPGAVDVRGSRTGRAALVVDHVQPSAPWRARGAGVGGPAGAPDAPSPNARSVPESVSGSDAG